MKQVTLSQLKKLQACNDAVKCFVDKFGNFADVKTIFKALIKAKKLDWANWLIARLLSKENRIRYAVFAAEQVIDIYEKKYPNDDRPRRAIGAAKAVLKKNTDETRYAAYAAYAAADAAAYAADAADADSMAAVKLKIIRYGIRLLSKEEGK